MNGKQIPKIELSAVEKHTIARVLHFLTTEYKTNHLPTDRVSLELEYCLNGLLPLNRTVKYLIASSHEIPGKTEETETEKRFREIIQKSIDYYFPKRIAETFHPIVPEGLETDKTYHELAVEKVKKAISETREEIEKISNDIESKKFSFMGGEIRSALIMSAETPEERETMSRLDRVNTESELEELLSKSRKIAERKIKKAHAETLELIKRAREGDLDALNIADFRPRDWEEMGCKVRSYFSQFYSGFEDSRNYGISDSKSLEDYTKSKLLAPISKGIGDRFNLGDEVRVEGRKSRGIVERQIKISKEVGADGKENNSGIYIIDFPWEGRVKVEQEKISLVKEGRLTYFMKLFGCKKEDFEGRLMKEGILCALRDHIRAGVDFIVKDFEKSYNNLPMTSDTDGERLNIDSYLTQLKNKAREFVSTIKERNILDLRRNIAAIQRAFPNATKDEELAEGLVKNAVSSAARKVISEGYMSHVKNFLEGRKLVKITNAGQGYFIDEKLTMSLIKKFTKKNRESFISEAKEIEVKTDSWRNRQTYVYTPDGKTRTKGRILDPFAIGQSFLEDLVLVAPHFVKNDRQKEALAIAKLMIAGSPVVQRDARSVLSKDNKIYFDMIVEAVERNKIEQESGGEIREFNLYDDSHTRKCVVQNRYFNSSDIVRPMNRAVQIALRDLVVSEVIAALQTGQDSRRIWKDFSTVWERYNPKGYDLTNLALGTGRTLPREIKMTTIRNASRLLKSFEGTDSCITGKTDKARIFTDDFGTVNFTIKSSDEPIGYVRAYCMEDVKSGEPILAVDTIEIPRKQFESHKDYLLAAGLAAIQFGLDHNFHYILGGDARVAHGIRQAFGDQYLERKLRKMGMRECYGGGFPAYSYKTDVFGYTDKTKSPVLMLNWKRSMKELSLPR